MIHSTRTIRAITAGASLTLAIAGLTACGGKSSSASSPTTTAAAASATPAAARGGFQNEFSNPAVQACLKAAGITVPTRPAGARPSGSFSARPSGSHSAFPSGARRSGAFGANTVEGQKIQAALKACGITLPTRTRGTAAPTGTPAA